LRQISAVIVAVGTLLFVGAGCSASESDDAMRSYALVVVAAMTQVDSALASLSPPGDGSSEADNYDSFQESIESVRDSLSQAGPPEAVGTIHESLLTVLDKEAERWSHMALFARTSQELHRVRADQLEKESADLREVAISRLRQVVQATGLDPDGLGLVATGLPKSTLKPSPSPTIVDARTNPTLASTPATSATLPTARPAATATASPTRTSTPTPSMAASPTPEPTFVPARTSAPSPAPVRKEQDPPVIRWPDSYDRPAFIAHWTIPVEAGITAFIEYPFVGDDELELSVSFDQEFENERLKNTTFEAPAGDTLVATGLVELLWEYEVVAPASGRYRFYFDNTGNEGYVTVHLLVTYHTPGPGTFVPPLKS